MPDLGYLRRIQEHPSPSVLLSEKKFLLAQDLFFSVVKNLGGKVDFDIANMREVHAVAALGDLKGKRILDIGCGSLEAYVLGDTFRDRYPPFFAEMLAIVGADITGVDLRPNPTAKYDHRVLDCTKEDWTMSLDPSYDVITCFSLFNAPGSRFEHDEKLCKNLMAQMHGLLKPDGILIVTLRDDLFDASLPKEEEEKRVQDYAKSERFHLIHCDGNCAWLQP